MAAVSHAPGVTMSAVVKRFDALTIALAALGLVTVVPIFLPHWPSITDLPEHAAAMATLAHWGEPGWRNAEHFFLAVGRSQYLLYHLVGAALTRVVGDALMANRLLIAAAGLGTPFALRALLRATRRDERLAIFACPLFWSRPLVIGFLPYVVSVPIEIGCMALLVRHSERPTVRRAWALGLLGILLFYLHVAAFVGFAATALALTVATVPPRARRIAELARHAFARLVFVAPAAACAVAWSAFSRLALHAGSLSEGNEIGYMSATRSLRAFGLWTHDVWGSQVDDACGVVFWVAFATLLVAGLRRRREVKTPFRFDPAYVVFLTALALYFLMPFRVGVGTMLNVRMASTVAMLAVVCLDPPASGFWIRAPLATAAVLTAVIAGDAAYEMLASEREEVRGVPELLERIPTGARLLVLSFNRRSSHAKFPPWIHLGAYHRVYRGGVASYSFSELAHWSLQYRPENAPPQHRGYWDAHPCEFRNAEDGRYHDYVLVRGTVDPFRDRPPGPAWRIVGVAQDFTLWEQQKSAEDYPPWSAPDRGPCVARAVAEAG